MFLKKLKKSKKRVFSCFFVFWPFLILLGTPWTSILQDHRYMLLSVQGVPWTPPRDPQEHVKNDFYLNLGVLGSTFR